MDYYLISPYSICGTVIPGENSTLLMADDKSEVSALFEHELFCLEKSERRELSEIIVSEKAVGNLFLNDFSQTFFECDSLDFLNEKLKSFSRKFNCRSIMFYPCDESFCLRFLLKEIGYKNCCLIPCMSDKELFGVLKVVADEYNCPLLSCIHSFVSLTLYHSHLSGSGKRDFDFVSENQIPIRRILTVNIPKETLKFAKNIDVVESNFTSVKSISRKTKPSLILMRYSHFFSIEEIKNLIMDLRSMYVTANIKFFLFADSSFYEEVGKFSGCGHFIIADQCLLNESRFQLNLRTLANMDSKRIVCSYSVFNLVLAEVAAELGLSLTEEYIRNKYKISLAALQKYSKMFFGISLIDYQKLVRIENATKLMKLKNYDIKEIASICGFKSYNVFRSTFFGIKGELPLRYSKPS